MTKLCFPTAVLDQHLVVLGKTGAGKSSALRHVVEYLLQHKKRVCIIDPKGDWYGLKSSADGKGAGFPVILFGDFKDKVRGDVPLIPRSALDDDQFNIAPAAKHVAQLVIGGNRPCVIGMRGWTQGNMTRFWIDFASTVFNSESGELYLVVDEVHNFAPKGKVLSIDAGKSLHWTNRLINEGRGIGLVTLIASQRPQKVHNDTLDACETLVAMRMIHKAARDAVEDWVKGAGDKPMQEEILNSLASMERGEAYAWSPEIKFGPKRLRFPMFETFDSFAPLRLQKKISEKQWAAVDLTEIKEKLAAVIAQAKAEDPKELSRQVSEQGREIQRLLRLLQKQPAAAPAGAGKASREAAALNLGAQRHIARLTQALQDCLGLVERTLTAAKENLSWSGALDEISTAVQKALNDYRLRSSQWSTLLREIDKTRPRLQAVANSQFEGATVESKAAVGAAPPPQPAGPRPAPPARAAGSSGDAPGGKLVPRQQNLLDALASMENLKIYEPTRDAVALFVGRSTRPSRWGMDLKEMEQAGLISYPKPGCLQLTDEGRRRAVSGNAINSLDDLHQQWFKKLPPRQVELLKIVIEVYPQAISRADLAERVQRSTLPSRWGMDLKEMRTLGLIEYPQQSDVVATNALFPEGLI